MSRGKLLFAISFVLLVFVAGCTSHTYEIRASEATRVVATVGNDAPDDNYSVVVQALHLKSDKKVWIELYPSDRVWFDERAKIEDGHISPRWDPIALSEIDPQEKVQLLRFTKKPKRSTILVGVGGGIIGGSILLSTLVSLATDDEEYIIPLYGSMKGSIEAFRAAGDYCDIRTDSFCGLSNTLSAFVGVLHMVLFLVQATGTTLIILGLTLPEDDRQRPPPLKRAAFDFTPSVSPYAEGGLLLTWRF
ncbi:MAG: hypothetical protein JRF33_20980 [Deltaproteobacteria bacterium]|nr:hypothetical protein [Deltaproteobacteria bacterium]